MEGSWISKILCCSLNPTARKHPKHKRLSPKSLTHNTVVLMLQIDPVILGSLWKRWLVNMSCTPPKLSLIWTHVSFTYSTLAHSTVTALISLNSSCVQPHIALCPSMLSCSWVRSPVPTTSTSTCVNLLITRYVFVLYKCRKMTRPNAFIHSRQLLLFYWCKIFIQTILE